MGKTIVSAAGRVVGATILTNRKINPQNDLLIHK